MRNAKQELRELRSQAGAWDRGGDDRLRGLSHLVSSKQPQLLALDPRRAEVGEVERREFAVEAVAAGESFEGSVDLVGTLAGAFHAAAELGVVEFAGTRLADG